MVKGKRKKGRKGRKINALSEQRCALYRKWTYPAVPPVKLYPRNPSIKQLRSSLTTVASPAAFIRSHSFIHSFIHFPLLQRFKPTNYHQLPPDGLCPCSCFSWPFKQPCINKPVVTNKKGGERLLFKALLREREGAHVSHPGRVKAQPAIYGAVQGPGMGTNKGGREAVMFQDMKRVQTKYTQNR